MRDLRLPLAALTVVLITALLAAPALAQRADELPLICLEVDQWLDANLVEMSKRQEIYYQANGQYWQGLSTHIEAPAYGEGSTKEEIAKEPDNFAAKPTDQQAGWFDIFPEFGIEKLAADVRFDVYSGPQGDGYTITLSLLYKDILFVRSLQFGPEQDREFYWRQVDLEASKTQ